MDVRNIAKPQVAVLVNWGVIRLRRAAQSGEELVLTGKLTRYLVVLNVEPAISQEFAGALEAFDSSLAARRRRPFMHNLGSICLPVTREATCCI